MLPNQPRTPHQPGSPWRTDPPEERTPAPEQTPEDEEKRKRAKEEKKKKRKKERLGTDRGIETMFRTSYQTHINLSSLADSKANIMISINGLIMSIVIGGVSPGIDANPWLLLPTSILLLGCLTSMVFAIQAARPRVSSSVVNLEDVRQNRANILFFGNFVNMTETDYVQGMTELMQHTNTLYYNMIRDIYGLGQVLALKFRLLRVSYTAFMVGLVAGVVLFIIVYVGVVWFAPTGGPAPMTPSPVTP